MDKKKIVLIAMGVVALGSLAYYLKTKQKDDISETINSNETEPKEEIFKAPVLGNDIKVTDYKDIVKESNKAKIPSYMNKGVEDILITKKY